MAKEGTVKLTVAGAAAVREWMRRHGVTLVALAQAAGLPHQMAASRAIRREGRLSLEQVGKLVSNAGGELTAAQLVGMDLAAAIPVVAGPPPRPSKRPAPPPPPAQDAPASTDAELGPRERGDLALEMAYPDAAKTLADASAAKRGEGPPPSPGQIKSALEIVNLVGGKARQREKSEETEAPLSEAALLEKLLFVEAQLTKAKRADKMESAEFYGEGLA